MTRPLPGRLGAPARLLVASVAALVVSAPLATGVLNAHRGSPAAQDGRQVYKIGRDVKAPRLLHEVKPQYTDEAKAAKIQGSVELEVIVLDDGTVGDVDVVKSLDKEYGLDNQAVKAVREWRFEPGTKDGKPVAVQVQIEMTFKLK